MVNVTTDGPGVVDEYLTTTSDGKLQVKLKAIPSKFLGDVTFDGWSGDASGKDTELIVSAEKAQNIHATFTYHCPVKQYPLIDLKQSWADMGKPMYVEAHGLWEREEAGQGRDYAYLPVDYNRDGILDYVEFAKKGPMGIDNHRENVRFWLGQEDGSLNEDPNNDNRLLGTVYSIIVKYGDFNDDGYPDFCSFSSGYDRDGMTGDYPVILMSGPDGVYTDLRYTDYDHGYFHGGTTGDIDNDGDIDVLFWDMWHGDGTNSLLLINDGKGNFTKVEAKEWIDLKSLFSRLSKYEGEPLFLDLEISDLNNDGYNDLLMLSNDHLNNKDGYICPPFILWGSESGRFSSDNSTHFPATDRMGYGIGVGFIVFDLNGDGMKEVIINRCADGDYGGTRFYIGNYFQVCEKEGDHYVDKTSQYFPKEHEAFNEYASEQRTFIEVIDGTPYLCTGGAQDYTYIPGVGVGPQKLYALRNGVFEVVKPALETKISTYDEGFPVYVDGPNFFDCYSADDGVNPIDTLPEHQWVDISDWDSTHGNMWRINLHHRKDTHFGRTCIRWNRDGLDPKKKDQHEDQSIGFSFISDVSVKELMYNDYYLEFYIKNSDPDLSFIINGISVDAKNTDEGKYTGEWQRMKCPFRDINQMSGDSFGSIMIEVDKGDHNNEFYLDDIRIRRLTISETRDEYERAFNKGYVDISFAKNDRTKQISSQEFKSLLKPLVEKYAPDSINYFNSRISDYDAPISRGTAAMMAYYVARCIEVTENNAMNDHSSAENFWDGAWGPETDQVLPYAYSTEDSQEGWQESVYALLWNSGHVSPFSNKEVIEYISEVDGFAWERAFTWEEAICAITRLYDSMDPEKLASGISTPLIYPVATQDVYYNLNGQRVTPPNKGVYIKNGKKIIIR